MPSEPITPAEKRITLLKLNQVIQHRLVSSNLLPQMRTLNVGLKDLNIYIAINLCSVYVFKFCYAVGCVTIFGALHKIVFICKEFIFSV